MGMVVRTNTMSANAYRQLGTNNTQLAKSLEKLSSGYRINRAGDDSSGLAISEKMKAQIAGLDQASANSQDGISLVQTAEGALTEVHSMLNRMVTLAEKSANGTISDTVDRSAIQTETDALKEEITRISKSTNFNGITLLDGSLSAGTAGGTNTAALTGFTGVSAAKGAITVTGAPAGTTVTIKSATATAAGSETAAWSANALTITLSAAASKTYDQAAIDKLVKNATGTKPSGTDNLKVDLGTNGELITGTADGAGATITVADAVQSSYKNAGVTVTATKAGAAYDASNTVTAGTTEGVTVDSSSNAFALSLVSTTNYTAADVNKILSSGGAAYTVSFDGTKSGTALATALGTATTSGGAGIAGGGLTLQVGDTNESYNKVTVSVGDMSATGLGIADLDVSTQDAAGSAIATIKSAINTVSTNRGNLGALQNRLEHAISNLDTTSENMNSANSAIRDTDMAKEMMTYTKMNILSQAAQAMLAQANQQPQNILQLLK